MNEQTGPKNSGSDQGSHETAALYVPANRLAKVDPIDVFTPLANRALPRAQVTVATTVQQRDRTEVMLPATTSGARSSSTGATNPTSVLKRLHGSNSDELFGAALRAKQDSLINSNTPRFSLVGKLGEGSQGIVYRINDRDCHREVACKVLSYATSDPEEISRFIHEAQVTAQLEHPGVVPIHDLGELRDGTVYYTMKRVDGVSLLDQLTAKGGKKEHRFDLIEMFLRVCETMAFAHSRGVVHRDLKPRNIMVGPFGEVLVLDWGLAKVVNCADVARPMGTMRSIPEADAYRTLNGTAVGTPAYMSPEQAMGEVDTLDRRCDIYSLGVILYEMFAGASPYVRGEARKVMHQVSHGMWTRLDVRRDCPPVPPALIAIVHRAMAFERPDRYQMVEDLARDLRAFVAGGAVSVYQETALERISRVLHHHQRQVRTALVVAGIALCIGLLIWTNYWYEQERVINDLHLDLEESLAQRKFSEAQAIGGRILNLRANDSRTQRQMPRIAAGLRELENARLVEKKRKEADELVAEAKQTAKSNDEGSLVKAGEFYMRALGLVGEDLIISDAYKDVSRRLTELEKKKKEEENEKRKRDGALGMLGRIEATLAKVKSHRSELTQMVKEQRNFEKGNRLGDDPTLRSRLHRLELAIETKAKEIADAESYAANLLDQALGLAPQAEVVRQAVANFYLRQMQDYEARGDLFGARMAEMRCHIFDQGNLHSKALEGQTWVRAASGQPPLTIQRVEENDERILENVGNVMTLENHMERELPQGRYLVRNALGSVQAVRLWRGERRELQLRSPPASLPEVVAFIPAGNPVDEDGGLHETVEAFALAKREVTCSEWLAFLNDPAIRGRIDDPERAGTTLFVPRDGERPLWPRQADGTFRFPTADEGQAIEPNWPVSHVSGRDAIEYAKWLSKRDQLPWRIPTHLEWQLAAQGGDGRAYPWGMRADLGYSASDRTSPNSWWCKSAVGSHLKDTSVQGVMDLGGSVAELVLVDGGVRLAAGGSHRDRHPESFSVFSSRDVIDSQPESGVGVRLALTLPTDR